MRLPWLDVNIKSVQELLWYLHMSPKVARTPKKSDIGPNIATPELQPATSESGEGMQHVKRKDQPCLDHPPGPPEVTIVKSPPPSLFSLIIGINQYADGSIRNLRGAVPDADQVQEFLVSRLKVQPNRIVALRDASATREAILAAIQNLAQNPAIRPTDPILIYYAGHGAEFSIPSLTSSKQEGKIQMILPYDFVSRGSAAKDGQGIFDITLSRLLLEVAKKKSDNITVILDCCHSGSGTRHKDQLDSDRDETLLVRGIKLHDKYTVPPDMLTAEQFRASSVSSGYEMAGLRSHVLLAACKATETAKERQGRGVFTSALLALIEADGVEQLTYVDVINRLPDLYEQSPQCEGRNKNRILFNSKVVSSSRQVFIVKPSDSGNYVIEAGEAHGIAPSSSFAIHSERELKSQSFLGTITVTSVSAFQSLASCAEGTSLTATPEAMYAVQTHAGEDYDVRLLIEQSKELIGLFERLGEQMQLGNSDATHRSFRLVNGLEEKPHLVLRVNPNTQPTDSFSSPYLPSPQNGGGGRGGSSISSVRFEIMEPLCRQYGLTMMPYNNVKTDETGHLFRILSSAADFYWKLHHSNKAAGVNPATGARAGDAKARMMGGSGGEGASPTGSTAPQNIGAVIADKFLEVECFKLVLAHTVPAKLALAFNIEGIKKTHFDDESLVPLPGPEGGKPENLCVDGSIVLDLTDPDVKYGFRITNNSGIDLYAALFYFDVSDLSISSYYTPASALAGKTEFTLPAKGVRSLEIGFGNSGTVPYEYFLRPNQLVDVGFLKLYFSTSYVDFSKLQQESPFSEHDLDEDVDGDEEFEQGNRKGRRGDTVVTAKVRPIWDTLCIPVIQKNGI